MKQLKTVTSEDVVKPNMENSTMILGEAELREDDSVNDSLVFSNDPKKGTNLKARFKALGVEVSGESRLMDKNVPSTATIPSRAFSSVALKDIVEPNSATKHLLKQAADPKDSLNIRPTFARKKTLQ